MSEDRFTLRPATSADAEVIRAMLFEAIAWRSDADRQAASALLERPEFFHYLQEWGEREGDIGVVAIDADSNDAPVGAAWARVWSGPDRGYGFVDEDTPELSIGVAAEHRGYGLGKRLLSALEEIAKRRGFEALSLSVEEGNFALGLYERSGFERLRLVDGSWIMRKTLVNGE